jgi:hypothetical protein
VISVDYDVLLKKINGLIISCVKGFNIDGLDFEDMMQIGRIATWKSIEDYAITEENYQNYIPLLKTYIVNALKVELQKTKAKKRINLSQSVRIDAPVSFKDERDLHELIEDKKSKEDFFEKERQQETLIKLKDYALKERSRKSISGVVWYLVYILDIEKKDIPKKLSFDTFRNFGLQYYLWIFFNNSPYRAVNYAYPNQFLPYQMSRVPNGYWGSGKKLGWGRYRAINALKKNLENTGYPLELYPKIVTYQFLVEVGLTVPLNKFFGWSLYSYLNAVFPQRYKPWEMNFSPRGFFNEKENIVLAVKWMVEEKMKIPMEELTVYDVWERGLGKKITKEIFSFYGLREVLAQYNNSPGKILIDVYPEKFLSWFSPSRFKWKGESGKKLAAQATRWVIEEYAGISPLSFEIGYRFFIENGLHGMITSKTLGFNSSPGQH